MIIKKGDITQYVKNFLTSEFFCSSIDAPGEHFFDGRLIHVLQYIRDYYTSRDFDIAIKVTSTFRTEIGNVIAGGVKNSPHKKGIAVDWKFIGKDAARAMNDFSEQILTKKYLFRSLRGKEISGFGVYDTFIHLDTRQKDNHPYFNSKDGQGEYSLWDKKKTGELTEGEVISDIINFKGLELWHLLGIGLFLFVVFLRGSLRR